MAQDSSRRLDVKTDIVFSEEPLRVGSSLTYSVKIEWEGIEDKIKFIPPVLETVGLRIENTGVSAESTPQTSGSVMQSRTFRFELVPTQKGEAAIEAFPIQYVEQGIPGTQQIEVPGRTFTVKGEPVRIPWVWIGIGGGGIGAAGLGLLFWILRSKARRKKSEVIQDPARDSLQKIQELEGLLKQAEFPNYVSSLSRLFSEYLHGIQERESLSKEEKVLLKNISEQFEELKYSKSDLSYSEVSGLKRMVEQFLEKKRVI